MAEDGPIAQKIVPRMLKSYGYQIDVAFDGKEAAVEVKGIALCLSVYTVS